MVERRHHGELREALDDYHSDFLYELCYVLGIPRSGPKYQKIQNIIDSEYDFEYVIKKTNNLAFGFMILEYLSANDLRSIIREYGLKGFKTKKDNMVEIIKSELVSPRDMMGMLMTEDLQNLYEDITGEHTTRDREGIMRAIIDIYDLKWLEGTRGKGFILMPITDDHEMEGVYHLIKNECEKFDIIATRVDEGQTSGSITEEVILEIRSSDFLFVDLSMERPNVYYELGYAHGFGKSDEKIVLMARKGEKLHFDIRNLRTIKYKGHSDLRKQLRKRLHSIVD